MSLPAAPPLRHHCCATCVLHQSFCDFTEEVRSVFDGLKTTVTYRTGEVIFDEGTRCHSVFAVCEGRVKLATSSTEGRTLLLRVAGPGEVLGIAEAVLGSVPYECSAIATEPATAAVIPRETFIRFIRSYPKACLAMTVALSEQYKSAQREAKFLAFGETSTMRLARLLLEWAAARRDPNAGGMHIPLRMTNTDLAQAVGSTRETITRILGNLFHDGVIERSMNGFVIIRPDELARLSTTHDR